MRIRPRPAPSRQLTEKPSPSSPPSPSSTSSGARVLLAAAHDRVAVAAATSASKTAASPSASAVRAWVASLAESQGGASVTLWLSNGKRKRLKLGDYCGGVARHVAAKAIGLMPPSVRYRDIARALGARLAAIDPKQRPRKGSAPYGAWQAKARPLWRAHTATHAMLDKSRKLVDATYNRPKTGLLDQLAKRHGKGNTLDAEFRLARGWKEARAALWAGAPVVAGFDHVVDKRRYPARVFAALHRAGRRDVYLRGRRQVARLERVDSTRDKLIVRVGAKRVEVAPRDAHPVFRNAHYVTLVRVPGTRRVLIHDSFGASVREVDISALDGRERIELPAWPSDSALRSTKLGYFRARATKQPLPVKPGTTP